MRLVLKRYKWLLIAAVAVPLIIIYFIVDPMTARWMPKCVWVTFTGFECPGCGTQRAFHALLHGDFIGAAKANPLLLVIVPYFITLAVSEMTARRYPRLFAIVHGPWVVVPVLVCIGAWWIIRNII